MLLSTWHMFPDADGAADLDWDAILLVRQAVSKELERLRTAGDIGSPLDARVDLYCSASMGSALARLGDELRFVFITSDAQVHAAEYRPESAVVGGTDAEPFWLSVSRSRDSKCSRCWHRREDVGQFGQHPEICSRCVSNVDGPGEERIYA